MTDPTTLDGYQKAAAETDLAQGDPDLLIPLLGLGGEVGSLLTELKKQRRPDGTNADGFDDVVVTELGDILWYLAAVARRIGVPLSQVAAQNLAKTRRRWLPLQPTLPASFDEGFPPDQRFPRRFRVEFTSTTTASGRVQVSMTVDGRSVGDPIDDNARTPDHYRFHDVFHLSYAAILGWSPILRALMKLKRKADPEVDRTEDGARAGAIEEAIAAMVFELAKTSDFFADVDQVDREILRAVTAMTAGLEVSVRTPAEWERAILEGFAIWRTLRARDSGTVELDLDARTVVLLDDVE